MKRLMLLFVLLSGCTETRVTTDQIEAIPTAKQPTWSDEFNGNSVNLENWNYEKGFVRNNEEQYYTSRDKNVRVEGGMLFIQAHKEDYNNANYTSASILTRGLYDFLYGRLEIRAKLPTGQGVWPAFWTTGSNISTVGWPECGEIDIMEYVGKTPNAIYATCHYTGGSTGSSLVVKNPQDFHTYAIEWDKQQIKFFVDNVNTFNFKVTQNAFRLPHILRINLALGGTWGGKIDDSILPQKYVIDYVRWYADKPDVKFLSGVLGLLLNNKKVNK